MHANPYSPTELTECKRFRCWCREGELNPQGAKHRRILSTRAGSDPFGKFSTLFYFSTSYKTSVLMRSDPICSVLSMELLQFYYSRRDAGLASRCLVHLMHSQCGQFVSL